MSNKVITRTFHGFQCVETGPYSTMITQHKKDDPYIIAELFKQADSAKEITELRNEVEELKKKLNEVIDQVQY